MELLISSPCELTDMLLCPYLCLTIYTEYYCQSGTLIGAMVFRGLVGLHGGMVGYMVDLGFRSTDTMWPKVIQLVFMA